MFDSWRWYGGLDKISLNDIAQTGAKGIVTALHEIPYGDVWSRTAIAARVNEIQQAGFTWSVVESLPIHERIKRGEGDLTPLFNNYRQSMKNLAAEGVYNICYNFMPLLDWTRTDLAEPVKGGGTCLRFESKKMAAFEIHMLARKEAEADYTEAVCVQAKEWFEQHSALAYLGYLAGYETIAETVADPIFATLIDKIWMQEIIPTVPQPEGEDLEAYCAALKQRYLNPAIRHRTWQIAMDGSQKLPQRLLGTITDNLAAGRGISLLALAVAGWMRYVSGIDENDQPIDVRDPLTKQLQAASENVDALLAISAVFEPGLVANTTFRNSVLAAYEALMGPVA